VAAPFIDEAHDIPFVVRAAARGYGGRGGHSSYGIPGYRSAEAWDRPLTRDRNRLPRFPDHWLPSKRNPHLGG
jgi:hypothetical protein